MIKIKASRPAKGTINKINPRRAVMMSYQKALTAQHRSCDAAFAGIERAVHSKDWAAAAEAAGNFVAQTETHFRFEEEILFPALEAASPMAGGPVSVMRMEHAQMRELFGELRTATEKRDSALLHDVVETLLLLMQQHNMKEENVLYPIADQSLVEGLLERSEAFTEAN